MRLDIVMDKSCLMNAVNRFQQLKCPGEPLAVINSFRIMTDPVPDSAVLTVLQQQNPFCFLVRTPGYPVNMCNIPGRQALLGGLVVESIKVDQIFPSRMIGLLCM